MKLASVAECICSTITTFHATLLWWVASQRKHKNKQNKQEVDLKQIFYGHHKFRLFDSIVFSFHFLFFMGRIEISSAVTILCMLFRALLPPQWWDAIMWSTIKSISLLVVFDLLNTFLFLMIVVSEIKIKHHYNEQDVRLSPPSKRKWPISSPDSSI